MARRFHHPAPEDDLPGRAFDRKLMGRLLRRALPYRRSMTAVVFLILATTVLDLAGPFIVKWAIDGPLRESIASPVPAPAAGTGGASRALGLAVLAYAGAMALLLVLRHFQGISMASIGQKVMRDLRLDLFGHLQRLPIAFFDRTPVGRLTTRLTSDIEALYGLFSSGVVTFVADALVLAGIIAALFSVNVPLTLATLAALPPLVGATAVFRRAAQRHYRETRGHLAHLSGFTQESIQGLPVIQLFVRERQNARRFREINGRYLDSFQRTVFCYAVYFPAVELIGAAALALILWRGGVGLRAGTLTLGEFYLFWSFLGRFLNPIRDMAERYNVLQSAMAAAERIFRVLDEPLGPSGGPAPPREPVPVEPVSTSLDGAAPPALPARRDARPGVEIEFRDVRFSYREGGEAHDVLKGVSFTVRPGEMLAIVGATGAGKSTAAALLARFYEPRSGRILVDGVDISRYPLAEYRRRMGIVLQDPFLFSRSILENIRLGRPEVSREVAAEAARRTNADGAIARLPGGLDAVLGERGAGISTGEKQLLTFARALVHDPDILVLDEATSHVDAATEGLIRTAVKDLLAGRTSIVIAHRLSTVREADRIVVLHKGEVREAGNHAELLARRGIYHRLCRLQMESADGGEAGAAGGKEREDADAQSSGT
jgi:ATP-binding cassette subfamily B multidrug efflux pump